VEGNVFEITLPCTVAKHKVINLYKEMQNSTASKIANLFGCGKTYAASSKSSQNSLVKFTVIATVNKEMHTNILRRLRDAV
jgi:hypothetical protein